MQKIVLVILITVMTSGLVSAQKSFQKGNVLLNPAVGLGHNYAEPGLNKFRPSIFFSAVFGVHDYVSVGPYAGATFFNNATGIDFGARGNFHWWQLLDDKVQADLKQNQLDIYATLWVDGEIINRSNGNSDGNYDVGFTQGLRWYPNSNNRFALFGEFGYTPIAFTNLGLTIKIGK